MSELVWDDKLAQFAQEWALKCVFEHRTEEGRANVAGYGRVGENMYMNSNPLTPELALNDDQFGWYASEKKNYDYQSNSCTGGSCLHYTQVVWSESCAFGCGAAKCPGMLGGMDGNFVVCNYGPGGNANMTTHPTYKTGAPCSSCNGGSCNDGLCKNTCPPPTAR